MSDFNQNDQKVDRQQNAGKNINNYVNSSFAVIKELVVNVSNLFHGIVPKATSDYSSALELSDYQQRIIEIESKKLELKKRYIEDEDYYKTQLLQLRQREIHLLTEKLEYEQSVVREKLELTRSYYSEDIDFKKKELQDENDYRYSNLQVSRDSVLEILSQRSGKFIVIPSPLKISCDDLSVSKSFTDETIHTISKYIDGIREGAAYAGISCADIFRDPIGDMVALSVGKFIAPIPTLIFHTKVTHAKILMTVTITCPELRGDFEPSDSLINLQADDLEIDPQVDNLQEEFSSKFISKNYQNPLPELNWRDYQKSLKVEGKTPEEVDQAIIDMVSAAHLVVALCFCDLYCFQLNPFHSPQLFTYLLSPEFPCFIRPWADYFRHNLEEVQNQIQEEISRLRIVQEERERFTYTDNSYSSGGFNSGQIAAFGIGGFFLLLLAMCSQPASNTPDYGPQKSVESPSAGLIIVVKDNLNANVRTGPSDNYPTILTVPPGFETSVKSIDEASGWIEIDMTQHHPNYQTGWVAGYLVDLYQTP
ncbi:SH3 domain-containing protein [Nodosilinea sp. AN01ver1]|uniref:SH3 domain-containing protein n=1 Tax=Nodosilinea sp. AN01ver1 TaxID=3423362 RepID=UPI003D3215C0